MPGRNCIISIYKNFLAQILFPFRDNCLSKLQKSFFSQNQGSFGAGCRPLTLAAGEVSLPSALQHTWAALPL